MRSDTASPSRLQALAAKWRVIAMVLVAFAREITLAHKQRAHSGTAKADCLEAALFAALVTLSGEIATCSKIPKDRSGADKDALDYLVTIHALLSVMWLLIRQLRSDLSLISERWAGLASGAMPLEVSQVPVPIYLSDFLDSG